MSNWETLVSATTQKKLEYLMKSSMSEVSQRGLLQILENKSKVLVCSWCLDMLDVICDPCDAFCRQCLGMLTQGCLQAYDYAMKDSNQDISDNIKPTDIHPADDFIIIAAMCLAKLGGAAAFDKDPNGPPRIVNHKALLQACA